MKSFHQPWTQALFAEDIVNLANVCEDKEYVASAIIYTLKANGNPVKLWEQMCTFVATLLVTNLVTIHVILVHLVRIERSSISR